ncbi:hypothetical protein [sulfur-oxidizing endosymbiont of Gigantopelta aegis]|uniref:hypothetical protein n=1 Tax=sulfur-oxidizing endosymbiont of Gigantopelta aegis TaxID=2794934 RepID=UPI0018DCF5AF|nr:hypothetical protein [sulfur-oxidizing endosymbiont of Gigantopelta aegis]
MLHEKVDNIVSASNKADKYASKIIKSLNSNNKSYVSVFEKCHEIIDMVGFPSDYELKRAKFSQELKEAAKVYINR